MQVKGTAVMKISEVEIKLSLQDAGIVYGQLERNCRTSALCRLLAKEISAVLDRAGELAPQTGTAEQEEVDMERVVAEAADRAVGRLRMHQQRAVDELAQLALIIRNACRTSYREGQRSKS